MFSAPKAARVKGLTSLQTSGKILKVICELLILAKLHHIIEVLHVLDNGVQLLRKQKQVLNLISEIFFDRATDVDQMVEFCDHFMLVRLSSV